MKNIVKKPLEKSQKISRNQNFKISITHTHFILFFETYFGSLSI
jgi:hypothetical protein